MSVGKRVIRLIDAMEVYLTTCGWDEVGTLKWRKGEGAAQETVFATCTQLGQDRAKIDLEKEKRKKHG